MANSLVLNVDAQITAKDIDKTSRQFDRLAQNFEKQVGTALSDALKSGLDQKHLVKFEKRAQQIQFALLSARSKEERKQILAKEKAWKDEYTHIRKVSKGRLKAQKDLQRDMRSTFDRGVKGFAAGLSTAIGSAVALNLAGIGGIVEKLGEKFKKAGTGMQAKQRKGPWGLMTKQMGRLVKIMGRVAMKIGMSIGIVGLLVMAFKSVADHGAEMNKAMLESGAAFGDFVEKGASMVDTLGEIRNAFNDTKRNIEWMQTGKEQLKILGAWQSAG